jgi:hypothetical protein
MARIIQGNGISSFGGAHRTEMFPDIQRFQVHYSLKEIPEIQDFLKDAFEKSEHHGDLQDLYRRRYVCLVVRQSNC